MPCQEQVGLVPNGSFQSEQMVGNGVSAGCGFLQPSTCGIIVLPFICGTNTVAEGDCTEDGEQSLKGGTPDQDGYADEICGSSVLWEISSPSERDSQLGLCIRLCPDEPAGSDDGDRAMDKWKAECLVPKWSAMAPLSVSEDGCIGGVIKNTFVHIGPPPAAMQQHGSQRRSRSLPKDLGSSRSIWDATRHAFKFAQGSSLRREASPSNRNQFEMSGSSWAELSEMCDADPQESTVAPESDVALDEAADGYDEEEPQSWWDKGSWQNWRGHGTQWRSPWKRSSYKGAWKSENFWQDGHYGTQHHSTSSRSSAKEPWGREWRSANYSSDHSGRSSAWPKWNGKGHTAKGSSGNWWTHQELHW